MTSSQNLTGHIGSSETDGDNSSENTLPMKYRQ